MVYKPLKRCLIISVSGIGNTILQSALIENVLNSTKFEVDCLFGSEAMATVFKGDKRIRRSFILPTTIPKILTLWGQLMTFRYDVTVSCFPSNRPQFHLLPFLIFARQRVIHDYGKWNCRFSSLSNIKILAKEGLHDVKQNLNLLKALNIKYYRKPIKLTFNLNHRDKSLAANFLKDMKVDPYTKIIGIHPGSGPLKGKEWGVEKFAKVAINLLKKNIFEKILIFGGKEEKEIKTTLFNMIGSSQAKIVDTPLTITAALIEKCAFFLSNDTGLMHIAAACGTKVLGIFGPTSWIRTAPLGESAFFITPDTKQVPCAPCLNYPLKAHKPSFGCKNNFPCLNSISPEMVTDAITFLINNDYSKLRQQSHTCRVNCINFNSFDAYSS